MGIYQERLEAGYRTVFQIIKATNCNYVYDLINRGILIKPSHKIAGSKKAYYSADEVKQLTKQIKQYMKDKPTQHKARRAAKLYSILDVARKCKVQPISIYWQLMHETLPRPTHTFSPCVGKFYTETEFEDVCFKYKKVRRCVMKKVIK